MWNDPAYDWLKVAVLVAVVAGAGYFVFTYKHASTGATGSVATLPTAVPNPCDPATDNSLAGQQGNLVADPYFASAFKPLAFNPNNPSATSYSTLAPGVWYATPATDVSVKGVKLVPSDSTAIAPMPTGSSIPAAVPIKGALRIAPSTITPAYLIQNIPVTAANSDKQYEFRVCVFGDAQLPPTATISGPGLAVKAVGGVAQNVTMSYLADVTSSESMVLPTDQDASGKARTQDDYWTLYRFIVPVALPAGSTSSYVTLTLSGWKNQYAAKNPIQWYAYPSLTPATAATFTYVPPVSAFEGHYVDGSKNADGTDGGPVVSTSTVKGGAVTPTTGISGTAATNSTGLSAGTTSVSGNLLLNGTFASGLASWQAGALDAGQAVSVVTAGSAKDAQLTHAPAGSADAFTMTISQPIAHILPAHTAYAVSATFSGTATAYLSFGNNLPSDAIVSGATTYAGKGTTTVTATLTTGASQIPANVVNFTVNSYKQQPGTFVQVTNLQFSGTALSMAPTSSPLASAVSKMQSLFGANTAIAQTAPWPIVTPVPELSGFVDDFTKYSTGQSLNKNIWLLMNKSWGGDNNGVAGNDVSFKDTSTGASLPYLGLFAYGGTGPSSTPTIDGRKVRTGAAIVTDNYYGSGSYFVCAKLPTNTGVVSAFWTFSYQDYQPDNANYWLEPTKIRNSEIDWETPTPDLANTVAPTYGLARNNAWGGDQGEGGNDTVRASFAAPLNDGKFHEFGIVWYSGRNNADGTRVPGYVKWTYAPNCAPNPTLAAPATIANGTGYKLMNELEGSSFGQDNIPYRVGRFTIGDWFNGYGTCTATGCTGGYTNSAGGFMGWGGTPSFVKDSLDIDWVAVYPGQAVMPGSVTRMYAGTPTTVTAGADKVTGLTDARDLWTPETVPNAGNWSPAAAYPVK